MCGLKARSTRGRGSSGTFPGGTQTAKLPEEKGRAVPIHMPNSSGPLPPYAHAHTPPTYTHTDVHTCIHIHRHKYTQTCHTRHTYRGTHRQTHTQPHTHKLSLRAFVPAFLSSWRASPPPQPLTPPPTTQCHLLREAFPAPASSGFHRPLHQHPCQDVAVGSQARPSFKTQILGEQSPHLVFTAQAPSTGGRTRVKEEGGKKEGGWKEEKRRKEKKGRGTQQQPL